MTHRVTVTTLLVILGAAIFCQPASGQSREEGIVNDAAGVLAEAVSTPLSRIPKSMLSNAQGIVIVPNLIKGSFVIGARHGNGVAIVRDPNGNWRPPVFVSMTGGNVGWQVGIQSSDIILVFRTRKSVDDLLTGKFTIGADAAAAAGPVGRQASAGTDGRLSAEVYSYSRSRGLFLGVSIDGSIISIDQRANGSYYRSPGPGEPVVVPDSAIRLARLVTAFSDPGSASQQIQQEVRTQVEQETQPQVTETLIVQTQGFAPADHHTVPESVLVKRQLASIAPSLFELLDQPWQEFLALPVEVFHGDEHPQISVLEGCLARFDEVVKSGRFEELVARPEFQSTYSLLRHYLVTLSQPEVTLELPPPPTFGR